MEMEGPRRAGGYVPRGPQCSSRRVAALTRQQDEEVRALAHARWARIDARASMGIPALLEQLAAPAATEDLR